MFKALSIILVVLLACTANVFGLGGDYPTNSPVKVWSAPAEVNELINTTNRVHGFFVNEEQSFFYSGDALAFTSFLKQYAKLKGIARHRLVIHPGKGVAKSPWNKGDGKSCDWMLDVRPASWRMPDEHAKAAFRYKGSLPKFEIETYLVELHVWTKGKFDIKDIKTPKGVSVVREKKEHPTKEASSVGPETWSPKRVVQMASTALRERGIKSLDDANWNIQPEPNGWVVTVHNLEGKYKPQATFTIQRRFLADSARFRLSRTGEIIEFTYGIWEGSQPADATDG